MIKQQYLIHLQNQKKIKKVSITKLKVTKQVHKIAIIVPYRNNKFQNRKQQLKIFKKHILHKLNYNLYIIEQSTDNKKFNRGKLLNIGFKLAINNGCTILISHDVDLLPQKDIIPYYNTFSKYPIHIAHRWGKYTSFNYIGGILILTPELVRKSNGYPNNFWGHGGEDDALYTRLSNITNKIIYPSTGTIKELKHSKTKTIEELANMNKWENVLEDVINWKKNGFNSLEFVVLKKIDFHYIVKITV